MTETKVHCKTCNAAILERTAIKTHGYCIQCANNNDIKTTYKTKQELKKQKQERTNLFREKHAEKTKLIFWLLFQFFLLFSFIFNVQIHYPKIQETSGTPVISLLMVIVLSFGAVFVVAVIIYSVYKYFKNEKNT